MKMVSVLFLSALFSLSASAQQYEYNLEKLDTFKTCVTDVQKETGEMALNYLHAFSWWNMKDQIEMTHPEAILWHSSLAGLLVAQPALNDVVPFKNGQYTKKTLIETNAFLAYANDINRYLVIPNRLDCVGTDTVILITEFQGFQIARDPQTGCVTHEVSFGSPTKLQLQFAEHEGKKLLYRSFSHLHDDISAKVRVEMAKVVKGPSNVEPNPANCKTRAQILREFKEQLDQ